MLVGHDAPSAANAEAVGIGHNLDGALAGVDGRMDIRLVNPSESVHRFPDIGPLYEELLRRHESHCRFGEAACDGQGNQED